MAVEGVGAGHRSQRLLGGEVLQADGALLPLAGATRHLRQDGLAGGGDTSTLAAAMIIGVRGSC